MPKILINEKDRTSPGTPDSYANYTVLITGFAANKTPTGADSNDVFEFSTADAFKDTIGLEPPKRTKQVSVGSGSVDIYHYGNQMAYELLNMGYSVIYKVIDDVKVLTDSKFWEVFKDKASYDFRFVTHGLLESTDITDEAGYSMLIAKLDTVEAAKAELEKIYNAVAEELGEEPDLNILEDYEKLNTKYQELLDKENDISALFKKLTGENVGTVYAEYRTATEGTEEDYTILTNELNSLVGDGVTTSVINGANTCIANLAKYVVENDTKELPGRGDCIALIEIDEKKYIKTASPIEQIISAINTMSGIDSANGKYCALTVPSVHYKMTAHKDFDNNVKFPAAFHYLACFMNSLKLGFAEWYAAAGYTRGVASYMIDHTTVKLGEIAKMIGAGRSTLEDQIDYEVGLVLTKKVGDYVEVDEELKGESGKVKAVYDLQGRRVLEPKKGGLYIINNKKVIF